MDDAQLRPPATVFTASVVLGVSAVTNVIQSLFSLEQWGPAPTMVYLAVAVLEAVAAFGLRLGQRWARHAANVVHALIIVYVAVRSFDPDVGLGRALYVATWPVTLLVLLNTPAAREYCGRGRGVR
ncbi:hypothetical protein ACQP1P_19105 [Dactylosporangium sp. CA-052675]|uniref:hypothetical protein n=1 Tax=Dactylosporangium sp. CA-052675 TaxID=3239927 RepID=UPI003D91BD09